MSYTHSCSLHVATHFSQEVSCTNRSVSVALASNREVNRLHTTVNAIKDHIEDIPAMLNKLHVHAKLVRDVGMRSNMLGVFALLLLKSVLFRAWSASSSILASGKCVIPKKMQHQDSLLRSTVIGDELKSGKYWNRALLSHAFPMRCTVGFRIRA